jgi:hypothetical protein
LVMCVENIDILVLHKSGSKAKGIVNILSFRARGQSQIADLLLVPLNSLQNEIKFEQQIEDEPEGK